MSDSTVNAVTDNAAHPVTQVEDTPANRIYVGNLSTDTTDDELKSFFATVRDQIKTADLTIKNKTAFAFVEFFTEDAATTALGFHGAMLKGKDVKVQRAKSQEEKDNDRNERKARRRSGRRGSKPVTGEISEAEANGVGAAAAPATDGAPKPRRRRYYRNTAKAGSDTPAEGDSTIPAEGDSATPKSASTRRSRRGKSRKPLVPRSPGDDAVGETVKVFVANIPFKYKDRDLKRFFRDSEIDALRARINRAKDGNRWRSLGYGVVDVRDEANKEKAISVLSGKLAEGREISVKEYIPRPAKVATEDAETAEPPGSADDVAAAPASED